MEPPALTGALRYAPAGPRGIRVLVVEDNRDSAGLVQHLLYHWGYEVELAFNAEEGLSAAKRLHPHVVLCAMRLPDGNGLELAAALRSDPKTARARMIAVSARGADDERRRALEAGFDLHLVKPVDAEVLLQKIGNG
jgi:CheY-like chemotaxis protein